MHKKTINIISIISLIGLLNIFYLNATNVNNFAKPEIYTNTIPTIQEYNALLSEMQSKYKPGDRISDVDFDKNAKLSGQKVEVFETVYRLDTRSPDIIEKVGFNPNPNTHTGVGTAWDHYKSTTSNFVSTAAAFELDGSANNVPEYNKLRSSHYYGIEKPINYYAEQYKGSNTPPPAKTFTSYLYEIKDVKGIREPRNYANISNLNQNITLRNNEILTQGVDPKKITGVRVATNITVESWKLATDWFGNPRPGVWVPDKVSGDPYSLIEFLNKYKGMIDKPQAMSSLKDFKNTVSSNSTNSIDNQEKLRPTNEVEVARDQFKKAIGAGKGELTEVVEKILPEKSGPVSGNLDSATISSGQDYMKNANRTANIAMVGSVLAGIGNVSEQLKKTNDIKKQNQIINDAAVSTNQMVIGAGLFAAGIVGAKYLAVATLGATAGTVVVPVLTVTMLPLAIEALADPKALSNMANAILDPKSSVYTSAKVLETQFRDLKDFGKNLLGFGQYVFSQTKELINPSSNSFIANVGKVAYVQNSKIADQNNSANKGELYGDNVRYFNDEVKEGRGGKFTDPIENQNNIIGKNTTSNSTNPNTNINNSNINSAINNIEFANQSLNLTTVPSIPANFKGDLNQIQNMQHQMVSSMQDMTRGLGGVNIPNFILTSGVDKSSPLIINFKTNEFHWYDTGKVFDPSNTKEVYNGNTLVGFERNDNGKITYIQNSLNQIDVESGVARWMNINDFKHISDVVNIDKGSGIPYLEPKINSGTFNGENDIQFGTDIRGGGLKW